MFKLLRILTILVVFTTVTFAISARASTAEGPFPSRGEGVGGISGHVISDVNYHLADDPSYIQLVEFRLDGPASQVVVGFDQPSGEFFPCLNIRNRNWSCEVNDVLLKYVENIRIITTG